MPTPDGTPILSLPTSAVLADTDVLALARPSGTTAPGTNLGISGQALKALFGTGAAGGRGLARW